MSETENTNGLLTVAEAATEVRRASAHLTFRQTLEWLEQAEELSDAFARGRVRVRGADGNWKTFVNRHEYFAAEKPYADPGSAESGSWRAGDGK